VWRLVTLEMDDDGENRPKCWLMNGAWQLGHHSYWAAKAANNVYRASYRCDLSIPCCWCGRILYNNNAEKYISGRNATELQTGLREIFPAICGRIYNISCGHVFLKKMFSHSDSNFRLPFASLSVCFLNSLGNVVTDSFSLITGHFLWIRIRNYGYCIWGAGGEIRYSFIETRILYDFQLRESKGAGKMCFT